MKWERYTEKARAAVWAAHEEAKQRGQAEVATEHLLLGLLRDEDDIACRLLKASNVLPQDVCNLIVPFLSQGFGAVPDKLSQEAWQSIEYANEEASELYCNFIGTEHLLFGLLRERVGMAGHILRQRGLSLTRLQELWEVLRRCEEHKGSSSHPQPKGVPLVKGSIARDS